MILTEDVGYQEKEKAADRKKSMPTEEEGCRQIGAGIVGCQRNVKQQKQEEEGCRWYVKAADGT